jgi:hypothetical protein
MTCHKHKFKVFNIFVLIIKLILIYYFIIKTNQFKSKYDCDYRRIYCHLSDIQIMTYNSLKFSANLCLNIELERLKHKPNFNNKHYGKLKFYF